MKFSLAAALLLSAGPAHSQASSAASAKAKRQELREVQKMLEQKKREIEEYQNQSDALKHDLSSLASETSESRRKLRALEGKISETEKTKSELKARLGALQLAEDRWQKVLADEINHYHSGSARQLDYFGYKDLWLESFQRAAILEKVNYVDGLHGFKLKTEMAEAEARRRKNRLQSRTEKARAENQTRQNLYQRKKEVYLETKQKVTQTMQEIQGLRESAAALSKLMRSLERRSIYKPQGAAVPLAEREHSLPWPVDGQVVSYFGKQQVPELHAWVINQGIRVATTKEAAIHPVKKGKVIFAGAFRSYGRVVILDHGEGFYSIYGMLGEIKKKKGQSVRSSEVLGTASAAAQGDGGLVYLEIRQGGDALDPLAWLQVR